MNIFKGEVLKSAYFDCIGGASGDMILGALIDAGLSLDELKASLARLKTSGFTLTKRSTKRGGVQGTHVSVIQDGEGRKPRQFQDFINIIEESDLSPRVASMSRNVFGRLAEAEAMVHRTSIDELELHELGEIDTLVDIVGSVMGLEMLGIERIYSSPLPSGSGLVKSAHGLIPIPAPATAALFSIARAPVVPPPGNVIDVGEMVTPTGAAILTTLATFRQPAMNIERVGYGLGSRDSEHYPNALALWLGEENDLKYNSRLSLIETNIDDMPGEFLGYVQTRLFDIGARDVWFTPIQMKKNRPATMISAIVPSDIEHRAVTLILEESTTLGVRVRDLNRYEAERESVEVETSLGIVNLKIKKLGGKPKAVSPEYEDCKRIAKNTGLPLQEVYRKIQQETEAKILGE